MNCEVTASTNGVPFYGVDDGAVFVTVMSDGTISGPYIKTDIDGTINSVELATGHAVKFGQYDMVVVVSHALQWQRPF